MSSDNFVESKQSLTFVARQLISFWGVDFQINVVQLNEHDESYLLTTRGISEFFVTKLRRV